MKKRTINQTYKCRENHEICPDERPQTSIRLLSLTFADCPPELTGCVDVSCTATECGSDRPAQADRIQINCMGLVLLCIGQSAFGSVGPGDLYWLSPSPVSPKSSLEVRITQYNDND